MATNFDITMKQYNGVDYDTLYPKTKGEQIVSPVPISSGGTNANNAASGMNNLISALSSITPADSDLIPFKDVSGNTAGTMTVAKLAEIASASGTKIQTGSYVGTGTYGADNPCSLTFDFVPKQISFFVDAESRGSNQYNSIVGNVISRKSYNAYYIDDSYDVTGITLSAQSGFNLMNLTSTYSNNNGFSWRYNSSLENPNIGNGLYSRIVNKTLSWYVQVNSTKRSWSEGQFNEQGLTYYYLAIG